MTVPINDNNGAYGQNPPRLPRQDKKLEKFGIERNDPFSFLKDDNWYEVLQDPSALSPSIRTHFDAENEYLEKSAACFSAHRLAAANEMKSRLKIKDHLLPEQYGNFEYWSEYRTNGNYRIYKQKNLTTGDVKTIIDGDAESAGTAFFDVADVVYSPDHRLAAYMVDYEGAGSFHIAFRDIATGKDLEDVLPYTRGQMIWSADSSHLYYTECDDRNIAKTVKVHVIGTDPAEDKTLYAENNPLLNLVIRKSTSGEYIFIESHAGAVTPVETRFVHMEDGGHRAPTLVEPMKAGIEYSLDHGFGDFYIRTNADDAVNGKIMAAPVDDPRAQNWREVVPQESRGAIVDFAVTKDHIIRTEIKDAMLDVVVTDKSGGHERRHGFGDELCHIVMHRPRDAQAKRVVVDKLTPAHPGTVLGLDLETGAVERLGDVGLPSGHNPDDYIVEEKFILSRDGKAEIPVTLLRHKDTPVDGTAPLYLYTYGAYGSAIEPAFYNPAVSLADHGVIYAIVHARGGNEKGPQWHEEGRLLNKKNTFYDVIDVAEGLAGQGYGAAGKMLLEGRSAGGLAVGAVMNERPDLFTAVIAGESFLDVINSMDDPRLPWVDEEKAEWGDTANPVHFAYMQSYSPYDNIKKGEKYPAVLATTGLSDGCVMYWEPAKWIARLRDEAAGGPFFLKVNMAAGHEGASARLAQIDEAALEVGFALYHFEKCGYDISLKKKPGAEHRPVINPPRRGMA